MHFRTAAIDVGRRFAFVETDDMQLEIWTLWRLAIFHSLGGLIFLVDLCGLGDSSLSADLFELCNRFRNLRL